MNLEYDVRYKREREHILQMAQGRYFAVRIVSIWDDHTTPFCRFLDGKYMRLTPAIEAVLACRLCVWPLDKVIATMSIDDFVDDEFVRGGGLPPFHVDCRCRLEPVVPGAGLPLSGKEQAEYDRKRRELDV